MTIVIGQYFTLSGILMDADGKVINKPVEFASDDDTIVELKALPGGNYRAYGKAEGSATITATYESITKTLSVDVVAELTPTEIEISVGTVENSPN